MPFSVAFETLGCRLNQAETANLHRSFLDRGYTIESDSASADLCVINTCALTSQAASKCRNKIRSIIRKNPDVCIAAVGCYAQTDYEVLKNIEGIDYIVGTADKLRLADIIPEPAKLPQPQVIRERVQREQFSIEGSGYYPSHTRANIKIQEGCNFVCSFCIIPTSRGPARSRDFDDILRESRELAREGHREIVITGINIGTYTHEGKGLATLASLVKAMSAIEGLDRIRLSAIEPTTIEPELIDLIASDNKICPYLHVPMQSGDTGVLDRMRRGYTAEEFRKIMDQLIARVPGIGLGTDVVVGFPGESEEAFQRSYELIEALPYTHIHVFSFSARKGTAAWSMKDKINSEVINERSARMRELGERKKLDYYSARKNQTVRVLFEERESNGYCIGFSNNYIKVRVDAPGEFTNRMGDVRIHGTVDVAPSGNLLAIGDLISLEGEPAADPLRAVGEPPSSPKNTAS